MEKITPNEEFKRTESLSKKIVRGKDKTNVPA
jgi:hypothetical protein